MGIKTESRYWQCQVLYIEDELGRNLLQAGIESLMFALKRLARLNSVPDAVILNMGIWVRDWTASGQDYKERFETILQHGNYFLNKTSTFSAMRHLASSVCLCFPSTLLAQFAAL